MAPVTPPLINPSLQSNGGDDGAAGTLASATSAEKKQGSRAPWGPKVSNNFDSVPACRNPARGAKLDGLVAESEAAGGSLRKKPPDHSPQKKPRGEEIFLLRLDRAKAIAKQGQKEAIVITQKVDGVGNLGEDEEKLDNENIEDADGLEDGFAACNKAGFESIPARRNPVCRAKLNGGKAPPITQEVDGVGG